MWNCVTIGDVPIHRYRYVSVTDSLVLTNIELTDNVTVNRSDTDIIKSCPPACNYIFVEVIMY